MKDVYIIWNEYAPDGPLVYGYVTSLDDIDQAMLDLAEVYNFDPEEIDYRKVEFIGTSHA